MSPRLALAGAATAAALSLGIAFALPASALPGDSTDCPEGSQKTCTQTPPNNCPAGTVLAPVQTPGSTTCTLDSVVRARAKAELLTQDQLLKLCADVHIRHLANIRVAVGHPRWEIITLDGKTCAPVVTTTPTPAPVDTTPAPLPTAPAPVVVDNHLPVTH